MASRDLEADEVGAANGHQERKWGFWNWRDIGMEGDVYMRRLTILLTPWFSIKLHQIFRPDKQRELHDHPWSFLSIILRGSYVEAVPCPGCALHGCWDRLGDSVPHYALRRRRWWNWKPATGRHSIRELSRSPVWTLVFTGPKRRVWGFWVNNGTRFVEWDQYDKLYGA